MVRASNGHRFPRSCVAAAAVAALLAAGCSSSSDPESAPGERSTASLAVGGETLPPTDVEEFTSFDAEELAATCGDSPQLPSQQVCSMPFIRGEDSDLPVVIVRATYTGPERFFALPQDDDCAADPAACEDAVELAEEDVADIVSALDLPVSDPSELATPHDATSPSELPTTTEDPPADGGS